MNKKKWCANEKLASISVHLEKTRTKTWIWMANDKKVSTLVNKLENYSLCNTFYIIYLSNCLFIHSFIPYRHFYLLPFFFLSFSFCILILKFLNKKRNWENEAAVRKKQNKHSETLFFAVCSLLRQSERTFFHSFL